MPADTRTPAERLRFLMGEAGLRQKDVAAIIGATKSAVSMIVSGDREPTKAQVKALAEHFRLDAGYFL